MTINRPVQALLGLALVAAVALVLGRGLVYLTGDNPLIGGFSEEATRGGCPQTDNCVSSFATEEPWAIEPIACEALATERLDIAHAAVTALDDDVEVVTPGQAYVVYSELFRFPDDVRLTTSERGIEIISSSRLGAGDLGVNRDRVEQLRTTIETDPRC